MLDDIFSLLSWIGAKIIDVKLFGVRGCLILTILPLVILIILGIVYA